MIRIALLSIAIHSGYIGSKVAVSLMAIELGASQATIGVLAALYGAAPLILGVHSGRLADTAGMRLPMLGGAALVLIAMLTGFAFQTIAGLIAVAMLMGTGFVYYNVAIQNLAGYHGPPEKRARNFAILSISYSVSSFLGPLFAGFSIDYSGHGSAFLGFAALAGIVLVALAFQKRLTAVTAAPRGGPARNALDLLRNDPLRRVVVASGLMVAAAELYVFYMPLYGKAIGLSASTIGIVLGAYAAAAFVARFSLPAILRGAPPARVLSTAMIIAAASYLFVPLLQQLGALIGISFVIGLVMGVAQPISMMMSFERSPAGRTGEVTGLRLTANNIARIAVPLAAGVLGGAFGAAPVFWLNAANLAAVSWLTRR